MKLYLLFDEAEFSIVEPIIPELEEAGYELTHPGTVLVGDSIVAHAQKAIETGIPVVLFATPASVGTNRIHRLVNAVNRQGQNRIFVIRMHPDTYTDHLGFGERIADYTQNPRQAVEALIQGLRTHYPPLGVAHPLVSNDAHSNSDNGGYLDISIQRLNLDPEPLNKFKASLSPRYQGLLDQSLLLDDFLRALHLFRGGYLTRAAALLFGRHPQSAVPSAIIQCVHYEGTERTAPQDRLTLAGNILQQIEDAYEFVRSRVRSSQHTTDDRVQLDTQYQYPMTCVREVIVNAVVHREYADTTRKVHVRLFDNRLEVASPGPWTSRELTALATPLVQLSGESVARNPSLAYPLSLIATYEGEGSGLPKAVSNSRASGASDPTAEYLDGFVNVTVWPVTFDTSSAGHLRTVARSQLMASLKSVISPAANMSNIVPLDVEYLTDQESRVLTINEVATSEDQAVAIVGPPGSGKSVTLSRIGQVILEEHGERIPLLIRLRELETGDRPKELTLTELLQPTVAAALPNVKLSEQFVRALLQSLSLDLLVDGLDEIPDQHRRLEVVRVLTSALRSFPRLRAFLTSRDVGADILLGADWMIVRPRPWNIDDVRRLAKLRFSHHPHSDRLTTSFIEDARSLGDDLLASPLLTTLLIDLYGDRGYLPGSRFDIIAKTIDHVTETWDRSRGIGVPSDAVLYYRRTLEKIALASISSNDIDPGHMPRRWLLEQLRDNEGLERVGADSEEFLRWISARTDILIEHSVKSGSQVWYGFSHLVFAEYLAASRLVRIGGSIDGTLRLLINLPERYLPGLATLTAQALSRGRDLTSQLVPALTTMIENAQSPAELRRSFVIARALADAWPVSEDENKLVLRSARRMQDKFELKEALILKQDNKRRD